MQVNFGLMMKLTCENKYHSPHSAKQTASRNRMHMLGTKHFTLNFDCLFHFETKFFLLAFFLCERVLCPCPFWLPGFFLCVMLMSISILTLVFSVNPERLDDLFESTQIALKSLVHAGLFLLFCYTAHHSGKFIRAHVIKKLSRPPRHHRRKI